MDRAVIFDMDGVLVDSYRAHFESWKALAAEHGRRFSEEEFARTFGRTSRDIIESLWSPSSFDPADIVRMDERKEALFRERVAREFPEMDGARELIVALRDAGFGVAVGSSGPPENVDLVLARLGPRDLFHAVVTGRDVTRGKPDPQVYLLAANRLGVPPPRCLVIEDAPAGIEAATRAGMASVALLSTGRTPQDFRAVSPAHMVRTLRDLTPGLCGEIADRGPSAPAAERQDLTAGGRTGWDGRARRP